MKFRGKLILVAIGIFMCVQCTSNMLIIKGDKNKMHQKTNQETKLSQDSSYVNINLK